ncbi:MULTISPECIES: TadE family protein [unclassified Streptomyces]|uniref:TadE family protein n=1 Tax=unclassified Streptomyces TaxID=2593676 RepID=UPI002552F23C|nr:MULTISPECIES: TadE family protein [unclassified Streptomyces]WRZ66981.1 pilus assembly protein [Streptomyces sp. NBC_01257]
MTLLRTGRPPAGPGSRSTEIPGSAVGRRRGRKWADRGQTAVEFVGTLPLILVTLALLWQAGMVCYAWVLAGNAADKGVRAASVAEGSKYLACQEAAREDVPSAWDTSIRCDNASGGLVKATVKVHVPIVFPGVFNLPWWATGEAKAKDEGGLGW